jgi:RsiW-degrading membrane proteinase PrsW (M82 family)
MGFVLGVLFVTPFVLTYLLVIRWADRFEPEPWWLVLAAFVWGAVFATMGGGFSSAIAESVLTPIAGKRIDMDVLGATVFAPVFEETFKGLGVALIALVSALGLRELDGPLDGVIYGGVVGLGFTLTEDILYVSNQYHTSGIAGLLGLLFLRTVLLGLSHCTFTACTGLGFGIAAESKNPATKVLAPLIGFGCAMAMHAMHNYLPTELGGLGLVMMLLVSWIIDLVFFFLLAVLVVRDRAIVVRELFGEVGQLLHARELRLVSSYFTLSTMNLSVLFAKGWAPFRVRRDKQLKLVELAFLKSRRRRGDVGPEIDRKEAELRQAIHLANQQGVWLGR